MGAFWIVYVDNIIFVGYSRTILSPLASRIANKVQVRMEEDVSKFLGIVIERNT